LWPRRLAGVAGGAALDAGFAGYPVDLPLPAAGLRDWYAWKSLRGFPPYARSNVGWITPKAYPRVTRDPTQLKINPQASSLPAPRRRCGRSGCRRLPAVPRRTRPGPPRGSAIQGDDLRGAGRLPGGRGPGCRPSPRRYTAAGCRTAPVAG